MSAPAPGSRTGPGVPEQAHEVAVVGAGPVGMSVLLALRAAGVDAVALDAGSGPTRYPKSRVVSARSMEAFRHWGLSEAIREHALDGDWCSRIVVAPSLTEPEWLRVVDEPIGLGDAGPEQAVLCTQDRLESVLEEAISANGTPIRWSCRATGVTETAEGVVLDYLSPDGTARRLEAAYAVFADGAAASSASSALPGAGRRRVVGRQVSLRVHLDLADLVVERPAFIYYLLGRALAGQLLVVDGAREWVFSRLVSRTSTANDFTPQAARQELATALGLDPRDSRIERAALLDVKLWDLAYRVADEVVLGRCLRVGDAAHEVLPTGAAGLNLGLADAHALAWRLIGLLRGWCSPQVLEDYARERGDVAARTLAWTRRNFNTVAELAGAAARNDRAALELAAPRLRTYFEHPENDLPRYPATAPCDGAQVPAAASGLEPGQRLPHLPLRGSARSTLDLCRDRPVLLVWAADTAQQAQVQLDAARVEVPASVVDLSQLADPPLSSTAATDSLLVRPDGYVSWVGRGRDAVREWPDALRRLAGQAGTGPSPIE